MIRVRQVDLRIDDDIKKLKSIVAKKIKVNDSDILNIKINKRALDARHKPELYYIYEVDIDIINEADVLRRNKSNDVLKTPDESYKFEVSGSRILDNKIVVVGMGPAGMMSAYVLLEAGYKVLIIERGKKVEERVKDVEEFWNTGILNVNSNVQFGEGGAGTFSDGKLNTLVKDPFYRQKKVFQIFVENGANPEILYEKNPHIGTDLLRTVVKNIRNKIIDMGGEIRYETCLTNINYEDNKLKSIEVNNGEIIDSEVLILATGHSARDTFKMLYERNVSMEAKPFAVGVRIQHKQKMINLNQYGSDNIDLPPASYKLTYKASNNRGVYSFCMCPGGYVVNSSSENNRLAINGMSNHDRESENSNSAIIVTVSPLDFGTSPMDGLKFQKDLEERTFTIGKGLIPVQLYKDFKNNEVSTEFLNVEPIFKGGYTFANIRDIFPEYINESLIEAIDSFNLTIKGYNDEGAILAGVESRTSSPIRIIRNDELNSNIEGIYPTGEGAGYAGGITSAGMDGIRVAEIIAKKYKN